MGKECGYTNILIYVIFLDYEYSRIINQVFGQNFCRILKLIIILRYYFMNNNYDPDKQNSWGSFNNQYSNQNYPAYSGNNNYNPYGYTESNVPYQNMNNYSPSTPYFNNNL